MRCLLFLLIMLCCMLVESHHLERVKRLSSPERNKTTAELAKYVVSIRSRRQQTKFGDNHFCGGAIVAPRYVITAARCGINQYSIKHTARSLVVVGGTPNRVISTENTLTIPVQRILVPVNYTKHYSNNIALLKLTRAWPTDNPKIAIIDLPIAAPSYGSFCYVLGWGRLYKGGPMAGHLVHINVELLERDTCETVIKNFKPEMLCAGNLHNQLDENPCAGDTGSPMISNNTLVGVVSYRLGCSIKAAPSVYTDVWYHRDWINGILENYGSPVKLTFMVVFLVLIALSV